MGRRRVKRELIFCLLLCTFLLSTSYIEMADVWLTVSAFAWRKCQFSVIIALLGNWEEKTQGYQVEAVDFLYLH